MSYKRFKSVSSFGAVQLLRPTRHVKKKAIYSKHLKEAPHGFRSDDSAQVTEGPRFFPKYKSNIKQVKKRQHPNGVRALIPSKGHFHHTKTKPDKQVS